MKTCTNKIYVSLEKKTVYKNYFFFCVKAQQPLIPDGGRRR